MRWYEEPGTPTVKVEESFENGRIQLQLTQVPAEGASNKPIPVRLALLTDTGSIDPAKATIYGGDIGPGHIVLTDTVKVTVDRLNAAPIASVMRGFSAPVPSSVPRTRRATSP